MSKSPRSQEEVFLTGCQRFGAGRYWNPTEGLRPCWIQDKGKPVMDRQRVLEELERIVGTDGIRHRPVDLLVYEYDGSGGGGVGATLSPK
jgi:hypothetical protein